jgi:acyl-coenzyme A synthetase/AMP-(fatty) acid ligase
MDAGYIDEYGYVYVTARDDDVINVAGHRLSTSALEDVILGHPEVIDAAVVGVPENTKGEIPLCLYVIKNGKIFCSEGFTLNVKIKHLYILHKLLHLLHTFLNNVLKITILKVIM